MRAIILAAGNGTRLMPLTKHTPKPLVKVKGKPMIEHQIEALLEKNINDIIVVTGYLANKLEYLKNKYDIKLVHNDKYNEFNNIYTMYLVREYLKDCYVVEGDIYINRNFFDANLDKSSYFSVKRNDFKNEWVIHTNKRNIVNNITIEDGDGIYKHILSGVSYWSKKDGEIIKNKLEKIININDWQDLYWDNIVKENLNNFNVYLHHLNNYDCFEIDTVDDLYKCEETIKIKEILKKFKFLNLSDDFESINKIGGMTNSNFKINYIDKSIVLRIPPKNTKEMIDRVDEKINAYKAFKIGVDKSFLFIDDYTGIKITSFIGKGVMLNPNTSKSYDNQLKVIKTLKRLHNSNVSFNNIFDPFEMINKYENILKEKRGYFFDDYNNVKKEVIKLKEILNIFNVKLVSCHNDTVPENFIQNYDRTLNLIDWEYSGMNDLVWDLAAFCIECDFSEEEEIKFLNIYFENKVTDEVKQRFIIHKILQDFLWSLWSNIKIVCGEDLEQYSIMRYNRCKKNIKMLYNKIF